MRKFAALLLVIPLLAILTLSGCSGAKKSAPAPSPAPAPPPAPVTAPTVSEGPDLMAVESPYKLTLPELEQGLRRYLNEGGGSVGEKLEALFRRWNLKPVGEGYTLVAQADLNGDGRAEWVTALNGGEGGLTGTGALFVIAGGDGAVTVDRSPGAGLPGVSLFAVADVAGESGPEIVWSSTQAGAHTPHTRFLVSRWEPGRFTDLPGEMVISFARPALEGKELLLTGGTVGSTGAGGAQRTRTDRYRWVNDRFTLVDRRYTSSTLGYHRLIDGITAESFGRKADAEQAYLEALEGGRTVLAEGGVEPGQEADLAQAVRAFARFRLAALLIQAGRNPEAQHWLAGSSGPYAGLPTTLAGVSDRAAGCTAAENWARQNPTFLAALASPSGYAKPEWEPRDLCGPVPEFGG